MPDSTRSQDTELSALAENFDIVGEMARGQGTEYLIATRKSKDAKRRDDSGRVLIEIVRPPEGDESHALDHLASDTKLLSNLRHRRLVPVHEGRWLGADAFAVVREYVDDPSVADLTARGQRFTNTRTAAILREVHGLLQWAREQNVVHRHVNADRLFLEPTSDRVRVTFGAGPVQRVRTVDATTEDVLTVVRLATAMLTGDLPRDETEGRTFAELRPDLPERLHEETERLLSEPATDHDLTLYLALIGMADPVAEGETERDRIRAEVLEEQRVEREKVANERAEMERLAAEERAKLAEEGEELKGAFAQEKAKLEREFAAAQRLLEAERVEMQRIITAERAELTTKREGLERLVADRLAEIEKAAAADRASIDALRTKIQADGEAELERKRSAALEDLDDSEIRLFTGKYATPHFAKPKIEPLPDIAFKDQEPLSRVSKVEEPAVAEEPWSVVEATKKLKEPRRDPVAWRKWAVRGGIAAIILITAGYAVMVESRKPVNAETRGAVAPAPKVAPTQPPPALATPLGSTTDSTKGAATPTDSTLATPGASPTPAESTAATVPGATPTSAPRQPGSATYSTAGGNVAVPMTRADSGVRARRDSIRRMILTRAQATRASMGIAPRSDSATRSTADRPTTPAEPAQEPAARRSNSGLQDLMDLSDSLSGSSGPVAPAPTGSSPR